MIQRRNGTINNNRLPKNLLDAPFRIDQRYFWDVIGYIALYLEKINYYNLKNKQDGNWRVLVEGDPIIFMVMVINYPLKDIEELMEGYEENSIKQSNFKNEIEVLFNWYDKINNWCQILMGLGEERLAYKIKNVIVDVLLPEKNMLLLYEEETLEMDLNSVLPPSYTTEKTASKKILNTFHRIIIHIKELVKEYLQNNIYAKNNHRPNNAMYIAFTLLFKEAQHQLNGLSKRHLDFYYKDILKQQLDNGSPTKAIINVTLLPNVQTSLISKGTLFSAGKLFGSTTDVLFEINKPLVAYKIEVTQMQTLLFNASKYVDVGTNYPTISYVAKNDMIIEGKQVGSVEDWFVFGANKQSAQNTNIPENQLAEMGFIIGSPVLFLSEGNRAIEIKIHLEEVSSEGIFWELLNEIKNNKGISLEAVFYKVFSKAFIISYTTEKGWVTFEKYTITYKYEEDDKYFSINLVLQNGDSKLEQTTKTNETLSWPSIKVTLNEYASAYAYSFFKGVDVDTIQINVNVQGIKDVVLYNNVGKMATGKSFDLFGPTPNVGSYLMIGKNEIFKKNTSVLNIGLEWENIPNDYGGLSTYYKGYTPPIENDSFKVGFNALSNGNWQPTKDKNPECNLFQSTDCLTPEGYKSNKLNNFTNIEINNFDDFVVDQELHPTTPLLYTVSSQSGFVKLVLTSPQEGFGTKVYEDEYLKIATYNARAIVKNKALIPYPNKPFIPRVSSVSLNYKASDILFFKPNPGIGEKSGNNIGEFIHSTPFGTDTIIEQNKGIQKHTLLPNFEAEGYLFLGFSGVYTTTTVSLYFHFLHSSTAVNLPKDGLVWEYCYMDEWVRFEEDDIILDGTNGFSKSGIIEMVLPKKSLITDDGADDETYRIRISTQKDSIHYPKIKGVYLNAVETVCTDTSSLVIGKEIPKGSIIKVVGKFPDIKKTNQAAASYGGIPVEQEQEYYTRISERLRHKSRALSIWDYERLVLENFEEVLVAKCTNLNDSFTPIPGVVKIIVLSAKWTNDERNYFDGGSLNSIKTFLQKWSSPFANITVMNPQVEYLLVNCIVKFKSEDNGGYYINKLNTEISHFLSPIANIDSGRGGIGGNVVPTMLVSYIEKRSFIELVSTLTIEHIVRKGLNNYSVGIYTGSEEIKTTTPEAILSPERNHQIITMGNNEAIKNTLDLGIGNIEIGLDFVIGGDKPVDVAEKTNPI
ncbi:MAG: baseplate J/gp47 family protein [Cellulophaga sp.]